MDRPKPVRRAVVSAEEEWRTTGCQNRRRSYGRACLWVKLACGHCEQRMVKLSRDGEWTTPKTLDCGQCKWTAVGCKCYDLSAKSCPIAGHARVNGRD